MNTCYTSTPLRRGNAVAAVIAVAVATALLTMSGTSTAADAAGTPVPPACYGGKVAAPAVRGQTLLLIDRTTFKDPVAWRDFQSGVSAVIQQSGQRLIIMPFAGLAPGQVLARALDVVIEPPLPEASREDHIVRDFKTTQACVKRRHAAIVQHVNTVLAELQREADQPLERSEILYTIERSLGDFLPSGLPTQVLIFSDGLQHGSGTSFYRAGLPRDIHPGDEIKRLRAAQIRRISLAATPTQPRPPAAKLRVFWWGLLSGPTPTRPDPRGVHYLNAQILAHYSEFWRTALSDWGASHVDIGPTLNNPVLMAGSP